MFPGVDTQLFPHQSHIYIPFVLPSSTYLCSTAHPEPHFPQGAALWSCEEHAQVYEGWAVQVLTNTLVQAKISLLETQGGLEVWHVNS